MDQEFYSKKEDHCKEKTVKGNVFASMEIALAYSNYLQGVILSKGQKTKINAYHCEVCDKYHVGGEHGKENKRKLRKWIRELRWEDREAKKGRI